MPTEALDFYTSLFQNSRVNAFIHMDIAGFITAVNPAFKHYFGYADEDVIGKNFSIFFTQEDRLKRKPENEIETVLRMAHCDDKNFFVHKNGTITWVSGESILITHANGDRSLLKMIQDIQVQKDSERSLTRANELNEIILSTIEDFVILLNSSLQVIKYNPTFLRVFSNRELLPIIDFAALIHPYDQKNELCRKISESLHDGKSFNKYEIVITSPDGERVFDISCQHVMNRNSDDIVLVVGHDVTIQKRVDSERDDVIGFVAHELRNPLASIKISNDLMQILLQDIPRKELSTLLERNMRNIDRLNKMVSELYDATKISGGNVVLTVAPYDFDEMVYEAVDIFRLLQPSYDFIIQGKAEKTISGDRFRMIQVISNLIGNAVKYSNGEHTVIIGVETTENNILLSVSDHGSGIPAEQMPYIFNRFFRVDKTRNLEGIGLGLYLCRRIIDAHNGKIWVESEEGKGSVFYCSLPFNF